MKLQTILFTIIVTLLMGIPLWLQAQQQPLFETVIWFTDAVGNRDSVIIGYDPEAKWDSINPLFGEEVIDAPFDSVFEVRVSYENFFSYWPPFTLFKKKIVRSGQHWNGCPITTHTLGIFLRTKYPPVTVQWDMETFKDPCLARSYIASHTMMFHIDGWWGNDSIRLGYQCFTDDSIYVDTLLYSDPFPFMISNWMIIPNGEGEDTIFHQIISLLPEQSGPGPCGGGPVAIESPLAGVTEVQVFPNPTPGPVRLEGFSDRSQTVILDATGRIAAQQTGQYIDLTALPSGWYFLAIRDGEKIGQARVFRE